MFGLGWIHLGFFLAGIFVGTFLEHKSRAYFDKRDQNK